MKVLVIGGSGMLGHKIAQVLCNHFNCYLTFRKYTIELKNTLIFEKVTIIDGFDLHDIKETEKAIIDLSPEILINCVGIIKQKDLAKDYYESVYINSFIPHFLALICTRINGKLIHFSTDCVFDGVRGNYSDVDFHNAIDLYGKSKSLGEVNYGNHLTIRTSIIGHELFSILSLVDWFLSNRNSKVYGFKNAIYSGLPTIYLSELLVQIIKSFPDLNGIYNVSSEKINKFDLLNKIEQKYRANIKILPNEEFFCDRTLLSNRFYEATRIVIPSWDELIEQMYNDWVKTNYRLWKKY